MTVSNSSDDILKSFSNYLFNALSYASQMHQNQRRKGSDTPYVNHLIDVARLLAEYHMGDDLVLMQAALLHDVVEDTEADMRDVEVIFGQDVASVVAEVTDDKSLPKHLRKQLVVENCAHWTWRAKVLKLADLISNVNDVIHRPPTSWDLERQSNYFGWAAQVAQMMAGAHPELEYRLLGLIETGQHQLESKAG